MGRIGDIFAVDLTALGQVIGPRRPDDPVERLFFEIAASKRGEPGDTRLNQNLLSLQSLLSQRHKQFRKSLITLPTLATIPPALLGAVIAVAFSEGFRLFSGAPMFESELIKAAALVAVTIALVGLVPSIFVSWKLFREKRKNEFQEEALRRFIELLAERLKYNEATKSSR